VDFNLPEGYSKMDCCCLLIEELPMAVSFNESAVSVAFE